MQFDVAHVGRQGEEHVLDAGDTRVERDVQLRDVVDMGADEQAVCIRAADDRGDRAWPEHGESARGAVVEVERLLGQFDEIGAEGGQFVDRGLGLRGRVGCARDGTVTAHGRIAARCGERGPGREDTGRM